MITKIGNRVSFLYIPVLLYFLFSFALSYGIDSLALSIKNAQGQTARTIPAGSPFYVVLTVKGDYKGKIPVIPGLEKITQLGTQTSSSYYTEGQKTSQEKVYTYQVQTYNLARYTFGPLIVEYAGTSYTAPAVEVEIVKDQPVQNSSQSTQDTFLKIVVSKKNMVLGEDFFVTLTFYTRLSGTQIKDISPLNIPDAQASAWEEVGQKEEEHNGVIYNTYTVRSRVEPKKIGALVIPAVRVVYTRPVSLNQSQQNAFNLFSVFLGAQSKTEQIFTNPIECTVVELPKTDKLVQAVGNFTDFMITIDKYTARQGEAFIVTAKVTGKSAQDTLAAPELILPAHFKSYPSRAQTADAGQEKDRARIFEYILQGNQSGTFDFPEQQFTFFDPEVKKYKTLTSPGFKLTVTAALHEIKTIKTEEEPTEKPKEEIVGNKNYVPVFIKISDYYFTLFVCLICLLLFFLLWFFKKPLLAYYLLYKIQRQRSAAFADACKKIRLEEKKSSPDILAIFITLFSQKLSVSESSLTYDILCLGLPDAKLNQTELQLWQKFLDVLFNLKFGSKKEALAVDRAQICIEAQKWLVRLEN